MDIFPIETGRVVLSKAGRDSGRYFVVVKVEDDMYAYIADGVLRKLGKPKRKKIKHLTAKPELLFAIGEKLLSGKKVFDSEIRSGLLNLGYLKK
ncbi:MAG: RNA-binding protein [Christensenellales bacterium]|jgi:hypothetical protein